MQISRLKGRKERKLLNALQIAMGERNGEINTLESEILDYMLSTKAKKQLNKHHLQQLTAKKFEKKLSQNRLSMSFKKGVPVLKTIPSA